MTVPPAVAIAAEAPHHSDDRKLFCGQSVVILSRTGPNTNSVMILVRLLPTNMSDIQLTAQCCPLVLHHRGRHHEGMARYDDCILHDLNI